MKRVFYLKTCNTCTRIINAIEFDEQFYFQDIKEEPITVKQLDELKELSGSYESLFSRRAKLYKEMGLKEMKLNEKDFKHYILEHYTFLKRPVIVDNNHIFIGSTKNTVEAAKDTFGTH